MEFNVKTMLKRVLLFLVLWWFNV